MLEVDELSPTQRLQVRQRIADGGLGLLSAVEAQSAAFVASNHEFFLKLHAWCPTLEPIMGKVFTDRPHKLQPVQEALDKLKAAYEDVHRRLPDKQKASLPVPPATLSDLRKPHKFLHYQHQMTSLFVKASYLTLFLTASKNHQATLTSLGQPGAGSFLTSIPKSKDDKVEPHHFAQLIRIRLGLDMRNQADTPICVCKQPITSTHLQVCQFSNQTRRHEVIVDTVRQIITEAGFNARITQLQSISSDSSKKWADIFVPHFFGTGQGVALDITVTNPLSSNNAKSAAPATVAAEKRKHKKYDAQYNKDGIAFWPIAFDSNGAMGKEATGFLKSLSVKSTERNPESLVQAYTLPAFWRQRLCLVVQRELAKNMFDLLHTSIRASRHLPILSTFNPLECHTFEDYGGGAAADDDEGEVEEEEQEQEEGRREGARGGRRNA